MDMQSIVKGYAQGKIDKRNYWNMMREKFVTLKECQELLGVNNNCAGVHILPEGIIYEGDDGSKVFFDFEEQLSRAESMLCCTEREDWGFIDSLIPKDGVVLDIGANIGWFSIQMAVKHPFLRIYAFEPVKRTYQKMLRNLKLNNLPTEMSSSGGYVYAVNAGLYDEDGEKNIYVPAASEASSLRPINDTYYLQGTKNDNSGTYKNAGQLEETCQVKTMDTFCREHGIDRLDFIKCDTEGAEKMVFAGAKHVLAEMQPIVYTEMLRKHAKRFGYHPNEIIEFFRQYGYRCYREENKKLLAFEHMDDETVETNFFFINTDKYREVIRYYS